MADMTDTTRPDIARIHAFAQFWLREYQNPPPLESNLHGRFSAVCQSLGFEMDCGKSLDNAFPSMHTLSNLEDFERIVGCIDDVQTLGNAIFSQFRGVTYWAQDSLLAPNNRRWFCLAFARLAELTADAQPSPSPACETISGDITTLEVDAIVNAANCGLLGGGGVDGAIHRAAGRELLEACKRLTEQLPEHRGKTGQAYLTEAGRPPCEFVIHTPGPVYRDGRHGEPELLAGCYENSLRRAEEMGCASIAFPCISTGVYGYPKEAAAQIAVKTVRTFPAVSLRKALFCCFEAEDERIYRHLLSTTPCSP